MPEFIVSILYKLISKYLSIFHLFMFIITGVNYPIILKMRKLKLGEVGWLAPSYITIKWWSQDLYLGLWLLNFKAVITNLWCSTVPGMKWWLTTRSADFFCKGPGIKYFRLSGHIVSFATTWLCCCCTE